MKKKLRDASVTLDGGVFRARRSVTRHAFVKFFFVIARTQVKPTVPSVLYESSVLETKPTKR